MSKLILNTITSGFNTTTTINNNNTSIVNAIENTLSRDGTSPNQMNSNLDMNGHYILNTLAQSGEGFLWKGPWTGTTSYILNNFVSNSGKSYICIVVHTSTSNFATDLATGKWQLIADQGATGPGSGDLIATNNLSELTATKTTARGNISAAVLGANTDITSLENLASIPTVVTTQLNLKANLASPTFTGTVVLPASTVTPSMLSQPLTFSTQQATTSGTAKDFTGIPTWAKRITIMLNGVSTSGTSDVMIQIGDGSFITTGYLGCGARLLSTASAASVYTGTANNTGFRLESVPSAGAAAVRYVKAELLNISGNTWIFTSIGINGAGEGSHANGSLALTGILDRVRLTTVNGTDTFDAGAVNIMYE